jgi:hypothetical protein
MALRNSGKSASKAATPNKTGAKRAGTARAASKSAARKGSAKKGDTVARSTRKSAANAGASSSRPRTAPKGPVKKAASTARAPKRPAVPSRASSVKKATVPKSPAQKTAGTGARKAGSKPLAGGRSLSRKGAASKSAAPGRTREKTPLGRGGKGTPSPGTSAGKHARNTTVKRAQQASDLPTRQKTKPSRQATGATGNDAGARRGSAAATRRAPAETARGRAAKAPAKAAAKAPVKRAAKAPARKQAGTRASNAPRNEGAGLAPPRRKPAAASRGDARADGASRPSARNTALDMPPASTAAQPVSAKAPAQRSHQAPIPTDNTQPAAQLPPAGKKGKRKGGGHITPEQALANTRALLAAKQQRAHQPPPYPVDDPIHHGHATPDALAQIANERHLEEANKPAVQGHIAAQDRAAQGKRDGRD